MNDMFPELQQKTTAEEPVQNATAKISVDDAPHIVALPVLRSKGKVVDPVLKRKNGNRGKATNKDKVKPVSISVNFATNQFVQHEGMFRLLKSVGSYFHYADDGLYHMIARGYLLLRVTDEQLALLENIAERHAYVNVERFAKWNGEKWESYARHYDIKTDLPKTAQDAVDDPLTYKIAPDDDYLHHGRYGNYEIFNPVKLAGTTSGHKPDGAGIATSGDYEVELSKLYANKPGWFWIKGMDKASYFKAKSLNLGIQHHHKRGVCFYRTTMANPDKMPADTAKFLGVENPEWIIEE